MIRCLLLLLSVRFVVSAMVIWPEPMEDEATLSKPKPTTWKEKNLGQWCRNYTINQHIQCPQASAFHQFNCCGLHDTECCFALQGWLIVVLSMCSFAIAACLLFYLFLKFQLICVEHRYPPKVIYLDAKC
ncbi:unnamed protein product [Cylicocyclus nassatus]|uniref:Uncharacterized protein n=1 Tax=Cylicocyclus nassatus TaxID=53992 RepID=A0AA36H8A7_CYLNA|nr:unnamed protein product [Cylicocyclus nassatus]